MVTRAIVRVTFVEIMDLVDGRFDGRFVNPGVSIGQVDGFTPTMGPVELAGGHRCVRRTLAAHPGTEHESHHKTDEPENQHKHAQKPDEGRIVELEDDDESEADEQETEIEEEH